MISKSLNIKDYLTFFIGIFSGFYIRVIGILCVSEIVLLLVAFYILLTRKVSYKHNKQFQILLLLSALAFLGSIISSIVNGSTFINTAKWLFTIFLFVVDLIAVDEAGNESYYATVLFTVNTSNINCKVMLQK